tara:strand:+ start:122 stop:511 length:390 start_codon:yes stop_codon:yes gene_type:complete
VTNRVTPIDDNTNMTNNKFNTTLTKKGKNTMTTVYLENQSFKKTFNETIFVPCNCSCKNCNDEIEVQVEFEADFAAYEYESEIAFDIDVHSEDVEAIAVDENQQAIVEDARYEIRTELYEIAQKFADSK